ncbi:MULTISPECIES: penicillin-binding protein activator [unclassified Dyella]|uniref:penicillin-binding protein activator n=1 Tax=unclassified Dyella TaxID=2634549 RepID=UPI000C85EDA7|nr:MULTISPECIES: penicillin-binding protein activator [unclassified Dyella]MDR3445000.1 penicillin-binding protein activator [Dyella sp.]PMQ05041.1 Penicillin-binding protein activator LpoA [Dyella sp. AD56]
MRLYRAAGVALLISLALVGCVPPAAQKSPAEIAASQQADALVQQGKFDEAAQAYLALAQTGGNRDHYQLLAAEAYRQEGQLDRAAPLLDGIRRQRLTDDEPSRLDLLQAEWALKQHNAPRALQLTTQPNISVPPALQLRLLELRSQAMQQTGDLWGAARSRVEMDAQLSGLDQAQNRKEIVSLLSKLGVDPLKQRAAAMQPSDRMLPWVNEALTQLGVAVARPAPALEQEVGTMIPGEGANVREGFKMPAHIALLLPTSGNLAVAGTAIREGFFSAYADSARNHTPRPPVRIYDSGGTTNGAVKAYQQAVTDGAQLVIGPLTRGEVSALFSLPELPVPLLALNHPDDKSLPSNGVSEFGLLPETEGAQAADHMSEGGITNAFVIVSSDDFAQRAAKSFKAEFEARGGKVAGTGNLAGSGVNFASTISGLGMPTDNGDPSTSSNTGLFISMRPQQARLLLPQIKLARVNLPVFGTSHIYAGTDDASANRDLEGVEFCDAPWMFDAQPGLPNHADVASQLPAARGTSARLFAFGMDAWNLAPYLDWLRAHAGSYLPGASGQLTSDQFGRIRRVLVWAKFQDGLAHPINGSLQMDTAPALAPPTDATGTPQQPPTEQPATQH